MIRTKEKPVFLARENGLNLKINQNQTEYNSKITNHKIYDALLSMLENKRIRVKEIGLILKILTRTIN